MEADEASTLAIKALRGEVIDTLLTKHNRR
jgi:hypothetical protein